MVMQPNVQVGGCGGRGRSTHSAWSAPAIWLHWAAGRNLTAPHTLADQLRSTGWMHVFSNIPERLADWRFERAEVPVMYGVAEKVHVRSCCGR